MKRLLSLLLSFAFFIIFPCDALAQDSSSGTEDIITTSYTPPHRQSSTYTIIDPDGRSLVSGNLRSSFPYSAVARLVIHYSGDCNCSTSYGTGFMVSSNCMLTAAHCVVCEHGNEMDTMYIYFGYSSATSIAFSTQATFSDNTIYYPPQYVANLNTSTELSYDYAYIILDDNPGDEVGWFGLIAASNSTLNNKAAIVLGYVNTNLWTNSNYIANTSSTRLYYQIDTDGGQSGSPVYWRTGSNYYVAGIHTHGIQEDSSDPLRHTHNSGWRVTSSFINTLDSLGYVEKIS